MIRWIRANSEQPVGWGFYDHACVTTISVPVQYESAIVTKGRIDSAFSKTLSLQYNPNV